jgi:post-segregation antitoxin (ccd killing protein)
MKINRTYCLDADLVEGLKNRNINASNLINTLVREHLNKEDINQMDKEELKRYIAQEKLKKEYEKKMEIIKNGH